MLALLRLEGVPPEIEAAWESADRVTSSAITYIEVRASLSEVRSFGRFSASMLVTALARFESQWAQVATQPLTGAILGRAGDLVPDRPLQAVAAIHVASAEAMLEDLACFVTGSDLTRQAAGMLGVPIVGGS
jgi:hypothetical protein